jgi:2-polyprenyl-3-methyl-5-hydroxy-6-metoxy-1,4-benzoquinol methylase
VEEKARYDNHENSGDDEGYRSFLSPVVRLCSRLVPESGRPQLRVLDFGCGPHPALAHTLESKGFRVSLFDAFYRNDETVFAQKFDLIVSTEVFEHLYYPVIEIERLCRCLDETRGILVVMTQLHQGTDHFGRWWYGSDPSHVVFYSEKTLAWIQNKFKFNQFWVVSGKRELRVALP